MRLLALLAAVWISAPIAARADEPQRPRYDEPYPTAASKKGLQVEDVDDALALGVKHAAINVDLCRIVDVAAHDGDGPRWTFDDREYRFRGDYLDRLDATIRTLSDHGVVVQVIVLAYATGDARTNEVMLHPGYASDAPNRLGMFNAATTEGRAWLTATMEFLAERWSRPDRAHGRVAGYIVGNEVNSHWWWCNMGPATMHEFADAYLAAMRLMQAAVRRQSSWARVYISLEHHWGMRYPAGDERQSFAGKGFLDHFARAAREGGDFDWHIAYHPYPENLFEPRFWNDASALPDENTPRITFKNLDVLTDYLQRDELLYDDAPRRVILSEQGFHTPDGPDGELIQAAAFCAAYKRVERLDGVDAFILHRHVDHPHEGGLHLGLRSLEPGGGEPHGKKAIWECFRQADTPQWEQAFEFTLPLVGRTSWD